MVQIKNVAVFGASGALGQPVFNSLHKSGQFNITVISREQSKSTVAFPSDVKVVKLDYTSLEAVTAALKGQDAVVSAVGSEGIPGQKLFVDAAIAAGVKRFLPSEFGSNIHTEKTAKLPVMGPKIALRRYIEEKLAAGAETTFTYVQNAAFLDWGLERSVIFDWRSGKPAIYDGGDRVFTATTLDSIGDAVIGVLNNYEETKNRDVYIEDIQITQNKFLELAKKADPSRTYEVVHLKTEDTLKASYDALEKGDNGYNVYVGFILVAIFGGKEYGQPFPQNDNKLLGVKGRTEDDVVELFKDLFSKEQKA